MTTKKKEQVIELELSRVFIGPQVVTVRAGERGSTVVLRNLGDSDGNALRRALPAFTNRRLKKEISILADELDGLRPKTSKPQSKPKQKASGWSKPGAFR